MSGNDSTTVDALSFRIGAYPETLYQRVMGLYNIAERINDNPHDREALLDLRQWWEGTGEYKAFTDGFKFESFESEPE